MYSPSLAQFISRDPLPEANEPILLSDNDWFGHRVTMMRNLYAYGGNDPVTNVDPNGMWYWTNRRGEYCGPYVRLYTGSWCVQPNVWNAAMNAAGQFVNCWWRCQIDTHSTVCGAVLIGTEVFTGTVSVLTSRIPKLPSEIFDPTDPYKGLFRDIARRLGDERAEQFFRQLSRARWTHFAKGTFVAATYVELGISIHCSIQCG
jgi:RHS repeat-associated protein